MRKLLPERLSNLSKVTLLSKKPEIKSWQSDLRHTLYFIPEAQRNSGIGRHISLLAKWTRVENYCPGLYTDFLMIWIIRKWSCHSIVVIDWLLLSDKPHNISRQYNDRYLFSRTSGFAEHWMRGWILLSFSGFGCSLRTVSHIFLRLRLKRQWLPRLSCPYSYSRDAREQDHWFKCLSVIGCMVPADIPLTKVSHRVKWGGGKVYAAHRRSGRESNLHNNLL